VRGLEHQAEDPTVGLIVAGAMVVGGLLLWAVLRSFLPKRAEGTSRATPPPVDVTRARLGDEVRVSTGLRELTFVVDRIDRFESGAEKWSRLVGTDRGRDIHLELEASAARHALLYGDEEVSIADFRLDDEELDRMDAEQSRENVVAGKGRIWRYETSREVGYFQDGNGPGEGFYTWRFGSEDGDECLRIEKWEGEPFAACICKKVDAARTAVRRTR
jgi:hypothetical protein